MFCKRGIMQNGGGRTYFQTIILSAAIYFALPKETLQSTLAVLSGVGIFKLTFVAASFEEKVVRICIVYSTLVLPTSSIIGCTLNGRLTFVVERYLTELWKMPYQLCSWKLYGMAAQKYLVCNLPHQFKFTIRRDERDCPIVIEFTQLHTLMELAIIQFHSWIVRTIYRRR